MMSCAHICNANCTTKFPHLLYMYTFYKCSELTHHKWQKDICMLEHPHPYGVVSKLALVILT